MPNKPVTLSEEFMHKVAVRVGELIVEDLQNDPNATLEGYVPSKKFKSAVKDIMKGRKPRQKTRTLKTILVVAAVLVMLFACAMSVTAVRKSIYNFFLSLDGNHAVVTYQSDGVSTAPTEIETYYEPSYLPEGFEEESRCDLENTFKISYFDGFSHIYYSQTVLDTMFIIDAENDKFNTIELNEFEGFYAVDKDNTNQVRILWNDENYVYKIVCNSHDVDIDKLISVAESIVPVE